MEEKSYISIPAWIKVLVELKSGDYPYNMFRRHTLSYAHISNILQEFERKGFIKRKRTGRINRVFLTEKGQKLQKTLKIMT